MVATKAAAQKGGEKQQKLIRQDDDEFGLSITLGGDSLDLSADDLDDSRRSLTKGKGRKTDQAQGAGRAQANSTPRLPIHNDPDKSTKNGVHVLQVDAGCAPTTVQRKFQSALHEANKRQTRC